MGCTLHSKICLNQSFENFTNCCFSFREKQTDNDSYWLTDWTPGWLTDDLTGWLTWQKMLLVGESTNCTSIDWKINSDKRETQSNQDWNSIRTLCRQCCLSAAAIPHKRRHIIAYYTSTGWRYPSIHWHQFRIYSDTEISQQIWSCCQSPRWSAVSSSLSHRSPQANGQSIATMASA